MALSLDDVLRQMEEAGVGGLSVAELQVDGRYHRFKPEGERKKKKSGWYKLFSITTTSGREAIVGAYGRGPDTFKVRPSQTEWTIEERAEFKRRHTEQQQRLGKERKALADKAALRAQNLWERFKDRIGAAPYLSKKQVKPFGLRFAPRGAIMIPVRNAVGEIRAIQWINEDGSEKRFTTDSEIDGNFHLIGQLYDKGWIGIGEGYATCASVHMATGLPVVVAFHAGNLEKVASVLRPLYPNAHFLFIGDDDHHLSVRLEKQLARYGIDELPELDGQARVFQTASGSAKVTLRAVPDACLVLQIEGEIEVDGRKIPVLIQNAGRSKAAAAAKRFKGRAVFPRFGGDDEMGTDFNDLHKRRGLDEVREQLEEATETPPQPDENQKTAKWSGSAGMRLQLMLDNWVLLSGSEFIWDYQRGRMLPTGAMGKDCGWLLKTWLDHPQRRTVNYENVVFDPGVEYDRRTHVNLYQGIELKPDPGKSCARLIAHLQNICGDNPTLFDSVVKWLAYPLQHPGAKMRCALIICGQREGTGKSLFFSDVMGQIYGKYACVITHAELNAQFNGWLSQKLYCCAEEVIAPQDKKIAQGILKNLITGTTVYINEKQIVARPEGNHANMVFISNEMMPVLLGEYDRRFTVIQYNEEHPKAYFDALGEEIQAGGVAGLLHWLLHYPVGDFDEHTRPYITHAHRELVALGMSVERRFFLCWESNLLPLPHCCCRALDLYMAFQCWGRLNGERYIPNSTVFGTAIGRWVRMKSRRRVTVLDRISGAVIKQQAMVHFVLPDDKPLWEPDSAEERKALNEQCLEFQRALWDFMSDREKDEKDERSGDGP